MAEIHRPHSATASPLDNPSVRHEESDVNIRAILGFGGGLILVAGIIHLVVWLLFGYFDARERHQSQREYPLAAGEETRLPPEPRLQTNPREDMRDLRVSEDELLTTYGWVDKNTGVVRIPIEEAMKKVVQQGLPAREQRR